MGAVRPATSNNVYAGNINGWRVMQPQESISYHFRVSGAALHAQGKEFVLALPRRKLTSARRTYSLIFSQQGA